MRFDLKSTSNEIAIVYNGWYIYTLYAAGLYVSCRRRSKNMQYGYCLGINFLREDALARATFDAVAEVGFDYVELPLFAL